MKIRLVIFDCDGVMFETAEANALYYNDILAHFGRPALTNVQFRFVHMSTVEQAVAHLFDDEKEIRAAHAYRRKLGYRRYIPLMHMEPNLISLLKRLKRSRPVIKTAVATNRTDTMGKVLDIFHLTDYFDYVVGAGDVSRPKPYPDALFKTLDYFQVSAGEAVFIGDSRTDEAAAVSSGVPFIAYQNPELTKAAHHISRLSEIESLNLGL